MSQEELEQVLRKLPEVGTLVKDRAYRQVWRFEYGGKPFYLKFYPLGGWRDCFRRRFRGSPALREFYRLQWLQKAGVAAPRAVATLMGYHIDGRKGDALIIAGLEPSVGLDEYLSGKDMAGRPIEDRRELAEQVVGILEKLGRAGMGHYDLHLGNFVLKDEKVHLLDAWAVHRGGLSMSDLEYLAIGAQSFLTRTDLLRAWKALGTRGKQLPRKNPRAKGVWDYLTNRSFKEDGYCGQLEAGEWAGHFFKQSKLPRRWSAVSRLSVQRKDWEEAWPTLLQQIESGQFEVIKRSSSGDVLAGEVVLGGRPVSVVVKRPRRKKWYRYFNEIGRGSRARRAWGKSWQLVVRDIPTAWPLIMMEKRRWGYVTDAVIVFERIEGKTLGDWGNEEVTEGKRELLWRCGRLLRKLEGAGLYLYDSKASNWMVRPDEALGDAPMLIDVDSVRGLNQGGGLRRLIRSLQESWGERFGAGEALALVKGYAPFTPRKKLEKLMKPFSLAEGEKAGGQ